MERTCIVRGVTVASSDDTEKGHILHRETEASDLSKDKDFDSHLKLGTPGALVSPAQPPPHQHIGHLEHEHCRSPVGPLQMLDRGIFSDSLLLLISILRIQTP